jgi:glycosyltransferase involved in cell wall biosynthesis
VPELARSTREYRSEIVAFDGSYPVDSPNDSRTFQTQMPWHPLKLYAEAVIDGPLSRLAEAADLVHVHGIWEAHCAASCLLTQRKHKPLMISAHGMLQPWAVANKSWKKTLYAALLERRNLNRATCLCALTPTEVNDYREFGLNVPIAIIPNGVREPRKPADPSLFFEAFPNVRGKRIILFLGRIHHKKGVDLLCDAWSRIAAHNAGTTLIMAGPDFESTQSALELRLTSLGVRAKVLFTGMLDEKLKWSALAASHCFVLPSHSEGFSVAILEALASSVPVIITRQCNFPQVAENRCGWIIEPSVDQLQAALTSCLHQEESERSALARNGKRLAQERYSWERIGSMLSETYDWMLGGPKPCTIESPR